MTNNLNDIISNISILIVAIFSIPLNIIVFFALKESEFQIIRLVPPCFALVSIILALFRNKIEFRTKIWAFIGLMFCTAWFNLLLCLLNLVTLWFIMILVYSLFSLKKRVSLLIFGLFFLIFSPENLFSQQIDKGFDFESIYTKGLENVNSNLNTSKQYLKTLEFYKKEFSPIQQAQTNFLRLKIIYADSTALKSLEKRMFEAPDSLGHDDALIYSARKYLEKSMPNKAILLIMEAIMHSKKGSEKADYYHINLCEAYRQKQEYLKGIEILNEILLRNGSVSDVNRAYACNRLAAIYNEWGNKKYNSVDSVEKYSYKCISLSEKINNKIYLASSQNELSYVLIRKKEYEKALDLSIKSAKNFDDAGRFYNEINTLINQSIIYTKLNKNDLALQAVVKASNLCTIEENRNLFMRLYMQMSNIYYLSGNYKDAYSFMALSRELMNDFYRDRINSEINDQSAKYNLFTKEQNIIEEKQKNEYQKKQLTFLIIIFIFICIVFVLSFLYFLLKRKADLRLKTIEAIILTEEKERKRIASDLHDGLGPVLSAINLFFEAYIDAPTGIEKTNIETKLKVIINDAIADVSRISHNISPHILEKYGLATALNTFIDQLNNCDKIKIELHINPFNRFELKHELTVYRTITELINNTIKHANCNKIEISFEQKGDILHIKYEDDGCGFSTFKTRKDSKGMGIENIQNRIQSLGGTITFSNAENGGMKAIIAIPYKETLQA